MVRAESDEVGTQPGRHDVAHPAELGVQHGSAALAGLQVPSLDLTEVVAAVRGTDAGRVGEKWAGVRHRLGAEIGGPHPLPGPQVEGQHGLVARRHQDAGPVLVDEAVVGRQPGRRNGPERPQGSGVELTDRTGHGPEEQRSALSNATAPVSRHKETPGGRGSPAFRASNRSLAYVVRRDVTVVSPGDRDELTVGADGDVSGAERNHDRPQDPPTAVDVVDEEGRATTPVVLQQRREETAPAWITGRGHQLSHPACVRTHLQHRGVLGVWGRRPERVPDHPGHDVEDPQAPSVPRNNGAQRMADRSGVQGLLAFEVVIAEEPRGRREGSEERGLRKDIGPLLVGLDREKGGDASVGRAQCE